LPHRKGGLTAVAIIHQPANARYRISHRREKPPVATLLVMALGVAGKSADFIILDANPLENIANMQKITAK